MDLVTTRASDGDAVLWTRPDGLRCRERYNTCPTADLTRILPVFGTDFAKVASRIEVVSKPGSGSDCGGAGAAGDAEGGAAAGVGMKVSTLYKK